MSKFVQGDIIRHAEDTSQDASVTVKGTAVVDGMAYYILTRGWRAPFMLKMTAVDSEYLNSKQYKAGEIYYGSDQWFIVAAPDRMARLAVDYNSLWDRPEVYEKSYGPLKLYKHALFNG